MVAEEAGRLLKACGPETSIGIITFYSAQRDLIFEHLQCLGIAERDPESGDWRVERNWSRTTQMEERSRVGTVDGFQGKEFDVVLLSVVRANDFRIPTNVQDHKALEQSSNRKYGHLRLANRMNVAMSRQRAVCWWPLVTARWHAAKQRLIAVPALAAFLELCGGEHGIVR